MKAAILNSRQNLRPVGSDRWVHNTMQAVKYIKSNNYKLLSSVGMNTWEMLIYLASKNNIAQTIYLPAEENQDRYGVIEYYMRQFRLNPDLTDWRFVEIANIRKDYPLFQKKRDMQIINDADTVFPISLRPNSTLNSLLLNNKRSDLKIDEKYKAEYSKPEMPNKIEINRELLNPVIDKQLEGFIIHWTRTANNNWPSESLYDYYDVIASSENDYSHSARLTLIRILSENLLKASSRHYRKGISAVAFSELKPSDAVFLMKWRARYREMTFEPYGIAIRKTAAEKMGVRKVIYGDKKLYYNLTESDRPYCQSIGTKGYWAPEREWRFIGDIDLSIISPNDLRVIVWFPDEILKVGQYTDLTVLSLYD